MNFSKSTNPIEVQDKLFKTSEKYLTGEIKDFEELKRELSFEKDNQLIEDTNSPFIKEIKDIELNNNELNSIKRATIRRAKLYLFTAILISSLLYTFLIYFLSDSRDTTLFFGLPIFAIFLTVIIDGFFPNNYSGGVPHRKVPNDKSGKNFG